MSNNHPTKPFERSPMTPGAKRMMRGPLGRIPETQNIVDLQPRNQQSTKDDFDADDMREET